MLGDRRFKILILIVFVVIFFGNASYVLYKYFDLSKAKYVTYNENSKNLKLSKSNNSGHKGVYQTKDNKWHARISYNKKTYNLGTFTNYEDAIRVREKAEKEYFGEFNRAKEFL